MQPGRLVDTSCKVGLHEVYTGGLPSLALCYLYGTTHLLQSTKILSFIGSIQGDQKHTARYTLSPVLNKSSLIADPESFY